jgi:hypothetical protein
LNYVVRSQRFGTADVISVWSSVILLVISFSSRLNFSARSKTFSDLQYCTSKNINTTTFISPD